MPHITQIAATEPGSKSTFDTYIIQTLPVSLEAQQITGIAKTGPTTMAVHGQPVQSVQIKSVLNKFVTWLKKFPNVILVAHNGRRFDFHVLVSAFLNIRDINLLLSAVTFTEKNSEGQPRVTSCKRTLESVIPKMVEYFKDN